MRKTTIFLGLLMAVGLVGTSTTAEAQSLGVDLSLKLEKNFKDSSPTFFKMDMYKPMLRGSNWTLGPIVSYGANVSDFNFHSTGFGFRNDSWSYGVKFTVKL